MIHLIQGKDVELFMRNMLRRFALLCFALCLASVSAGRARAADDLEETRRLLQKGLTIHELDREIARLSDMEQSIKVQIADNEARLKETDEQVRQAREHAKDVLRAYYTGGRAPLWTMLLSVDSWKDALYVLEQTQIIASNDKRTLNRYLSAYKEMKTATERLETTRSQLSEVKASFIAQKNKMLQLQEELNRSLAALPKGDSVSRQIDELNRQWETTGLPLFRKYFAALSETMRKLPELVGQKPEVLTIKGWNYTFQLKDTDLNEFIHSKNKELQNLSFTFEDGKITARGRQDDSELTIVGRYELEEKPKNAIRFRVEELTYNGLQLPPGTIRELEETKDLSFYPNKIANFLQATNVKTTAGKLTVDLKISF